MQGDANLGAAVDLVNDGAEPLHQPLLDLDRAGAGGMADPAQRGDVVFLAHLPGQLEQFDEHGRHGGDHVDPVFLDQGEELFGVEARGDHQQAAAGGGVAGKAVGRGVIERGDQQAAHIGRDAIGRPEGGGVALRLLRGHRVALHTLGFSGGAGRIDDDAAIKRDRAAVGLCRGDPGFVIRHAFGNGALRRVELERPGHGGRRRHHDHAARLG